MKQGMGVALAAIVAIVAAGGGYWLGQRGQQHEGASQVAGNSAAAKQERKILYYRNPMGLPDTSPTPKKDPMGMDYIPVYVGEDEQEPANANQIRIGTEKVQKLGVRTEAAQSRVLDRVVRAAGRVEPDERRTYTIAPKFEGYVERLFVNVTGQPVGKGQPLFEVYSPELVSAQREYAIAMQGVLALEKAGGETQNGMQQLADAALLRLKNWDISSEQIKALARTGEATRTLTFRSPVAGIVTEKKAMQGMRFMAGESLYQIADLSSVWVVADVFEHDIALVKPGAKAKVNIGAYPGKAFDGKVSYVYPTLNAETRTVPVRIELANPGGLLKPAMYAQVDLPVAGSGRVVTVPTSAVIDSGTRRVVLVQVGEGRFEPREVKLGSRSGEYVEVLEGVQDGEAVVVAANFLIDAESNLKAALAGLGHAGHDADKVVSHQAEGIVEHVDAKAGTISLNHGPVETLKWPAMTMEFKLANESLMKDLKPSAHVAVEFVERAPGEWVITKLEKADHGAR